MTEWSTQCPSLLSFAYQRASVPRIVERMTVGGVRPYLIGDSGAFTMKTQGRPMNIREYALWCLRYREHFAHVANLDVIGDHVASLANLRTLEGLGVRPFPVVHGGAPWSALEQYVEEGYPYIALGGLVGSSGEVAKWLTEAFHRVEGRAVLHGFGMTRWEIIRDFPFFSVDSSSWSSGFRYGFLHLWDTDHFVLCRVGTDDAYKMGDLVRAHGLQPKQIADRAEYHKTYACMAAVTAWRRASLWLRARMRPVSLEGFPDGPHVHLAEASSTFIAVLARTCAKVAKETASA